jgi:hypothetical protein
MGGGNREEEEDEELEAAKVQSARKRKERVMPCEEARSHLRLLFKNEVAVTSLLYGGHGPFAKTPTSRNPHSTVTSPLASADIFFMSLVPVPPTRFRPAARMGDIVFENPQNELLSKILQTSYRIKDLNAQLVNGTKKPTAEEVIGQVMEGVERTRVFGMLLEGLIQLQVDVNSFMDSNKNPTIMRGGKLPPSGVKQTLEKKDGLFRKHMMVCLLYSSWSSSVCLGFGLILFLRIDRVNESTSPPDPLSRQMSISRPTRLESRPSLRESSPSLSLSRATTSMPCVKPSSTDPRSIRERRSSSTRMDLSSPSFVCLLPPYSFTGSFPVLSSVS